MTSYPPRAKSVPPGAGNSSRVTGRLFIPANDTRLTDFAAAIDAAAADIEARSISLLADALHAVDGGASRFQHLEKIVRMPGHGDI